MRGSSPPSLVAAPPVSVTRPRVSDRAYSAVMTTWIKSITVDCEDALPVAAFWAAALGGELDEDSTSEKAYVEAPGWGGVNLWFQRVAEPKIAKNRLHLDLRAPGSVPDEVARLEALGATVQAVHGDDDTALTVMLDPGGNEFCVEL